MGPDHLSGNILKKSVNTKPCDQKGTMQPESLYILDIRVDAVNYEKAVYIIMEWVRNGSRRYICAANVHMVMEAHDSAEFRQAVNSADLVTPDGMPLAWGLRLLGAGKQGKVCGPDLTMRLLERSEEEGVPVGFYGGSQEVLEKLIIAVRKRFPELNIAYSYSPPFRPLTEEEDDRVVKELNASGASLLFVGLGCPKQEQWMAEHKKSLHMVQLGVGAAFDFIAGTKRRAPKWMGTTGLEWLYRLSSEPQRLAERYLVNNPRFLLYFFIYLIKSRH